MAVIAWINLGTEAGPIARTAAGRTGHRTARP
jgi:hypothetical protein